MGCGDEKLSKYLTQTFMAHCSAMICQQVTLSGDAEWPKVADAVIEAFNPFWEFVAGPLHAGTFGPNTLDNTFGPQVQFLSIPPDLKPNRPPSDGLQFFGMVKVSGTDEVMTVSLHNLRGEKLYSIDLNPEVS